MQLLHKLEALIHGWVKNLPHLPDGARVWLAANVWWIVLVGVIISSITLLFALVGIFALVALVGSVSTVYYVSGTGFATWGIVTGIVSFAISAIVLALMAISIKPLKAQLKKGWVILFGAWLVNVAGSVLGAILAFNPFTFIFSLLFTAVFAAISGYFLFEIHSKFAHETKKSARSAKVTKATPKK